MLRSMGEGGETRRRKRMENRQEEHARRDGVERLDLHPHREVGRQRVIRRRRVTFQGSRKRGDCGGVFDHPCTLPRSAAAGFAYRIIPLRTA
jgi:hypothetical protein